jgi:hypothetical protein
MFDNVTGEHHDTATHHANGQYKFSYDWNPNTDTLTSVLRDTTGAAIDTHSITTTAHFEVSAFGLTSGINGNNDNPAQKYDYFIDAVTYTVVGAPGWQVDADGDWNVASNWAGGTPNGAGVTANLGSVITAGRIVYANSPVTVGALNINNANTYLIAGLGTLTLQGSAGSATVDVQGGAHKINLPVTIADNTTINVGTGATLRLSDPVTINSGKTLSQTGPGLLLYESTVRTLGSVAFANSVHMTGLTVESSGSATLLAGQNKTLRADSLSVAGTLDLTDNRMITTASAADVTGMIASGHIVSSSDHGTLTALGVATAAQVKGIADNATANWGGQAVNGSDTLVMYTYAGDANLDGRITVDDYGRIDFNVGLGTAGWFNGDFNYDGKITVDDYGIIDFNVGIQGAPMGSSVGGLSAVPEPTAAGLLFAGAIGGLAARRRRR